MNTVLLIVLVVMLAVPVSLLFVPLVLTIDSVRHKYYLAARGIASLHVIFTDDLPLLRLQLPFYSREFNPFSKPDKKKKTKEKERSQPGEKRRKGPQMTPAKIMAMVRSFRLRRFSLSLDTGDFVQNAMLVPVMQLGRNRGFDVGVNFTGHTDIVLVISNNLWRIGKAYLLTNGK